MNEITVRIYSKAFISVNATFIVNMLCKFCYKLCNFFIMKIIFISFFLYV